MILIFPDHRRERKLRERYARLVYGTFNGTPDHPICSSDVMTDQKGAIPEVIVQRVQSSNDLGNGSTGGEGLRECEVRGCLIER